MKLVNSLMKKRRKVQDIEKYRKTRSQVTDSELLGCDKLLLVTWGLEGRSRRVEYLSRQYPFVIRGRSIKPLPIGEEDP